MWRQAVLLCSVTTGQNHFRINTSIETEGNITNGTYDIPAHFSGLLDNLIGQILAVAPNRRPSIEEVSSIHG